MDNSVKTNRYSDDDLEVFKERIMEKLTIAREELAEFVSSLGSNDFNDNDGGLKTLEDGAGTLEKESINQLAGRQKKFIIQLEDALVRIENKTYGICKLTGLRIQKERLMAVPHTTLSMEAKLKQGSGRSFL
jgi:RNA polymerase-binding transcription factor DksA